MTISSSKKKKAMGCRLMRDQNVKKASGGGDERENKEGEARSSKEGGKDGVDERWTKVGVWQGVRRDFRRKDW